MVRVYKKQQSSVDESFIKFQWYQSFSVKDELRLFSNSQALFEFLFQIEGISGFKWDLRDFSVSESGLNS